MKLYSVQYLRGLAAVLVLIAHSLEHPLPYDQYDFVRLGRLGVVMFFVISGFIMTFISGEERFAPGPFLKRRLIRVVPLYWLATLVVAGAALLIPFAFRNTYFSIQHLILSLLFVPHVSPGGDTAPILKLGWTLNYEMFFYVCFAGLAFLRAVPRLVVLTIGFGALAAYGSLVAPTNVVVQYYSSYLLLSFCAGGWIGLATLRGVSFGRTLRGTAVLVALALAGLAIAFLYQRGVKGWEVVAFGLTLFSSALLLLALGREAQVGKSAALAKVGDASYSIYVSHMSVIGAVVVFSKKLLGGAATYPVMALAGMTGGLIVGLIVYELVERPLIRLFQSPARKRAAAAHPVVPVPCDGVNPGTIS